MPEQSPGVAESQAPCEYGVQVFLQHWDIGVETKGVVEEIKCSVVCSIKLLFGKHTVSGEGRVVTSYAKGAWGRDDSRFMGKAGRRSQSCVKESTKYFVRNILVGVAMVLAVVMGFGSVAFVNWKGGRVDKSDLPGDQRELELVAEPEALLKVGSAWVGRGRLV